MASAAKDAVSEKTNILTYLKITSFPFIAEQFFFSNPGNGTVTPAPPNTWSSWSEWTQCSRTCGGGRQSRSRRCLTENQVQLDCSGELIQLQDCNTEVRCPGM